MARSLNLVSWVMLWWSHRVVNIGLLRIECLIQRTENKASWAKMLDTTTHYKNRPYFPLPHHLFLRKTHAACSYLPTLLFCCRFLPWFWFTFPLTHHLFFNSLVRSKVKMRSKTSKLIQTGSLSLSHFPQDHLMSRFMVQKINCISWPRGDQIVGAQFILAKLKRWANIPEYQFIHLFSISAVKQFHFSWLLY